MTFKDDFRSFATNDFARDHFSYKDDRGFFVIFTLEIFLFSTAFFYEFWDQPFPYLVQDVIGICSLSAYILMTLYTGWQKRGGFNMYHTEAIWVTLILVSGCLFGYAYHSKDNMMKNIYGTIFFTLYVLWNSLWNIRSRFAILQPCELSLLLDSPKPKKTTTKNANAKRQKKRKDKEVEEDDVDSVHDTSINSIADS